MCKKSKFIYSTFIELRRSIFIIFWVEAQPAVYFYFTSQLVVPKGWTPIGDCQLKQKYPDKPIAIVLDNARYQHCFFVTTWAKSLGIHLLFLPPYSPNLNIIERVWKFTKKEILNAQYYDSPAAFHQTINTFFQNINDNYKQQMEKLLTLTFNSLRMPLHIPMRREV